MGIFFSLADLARGEPMAIKVALPDINLALPDINLALQTSYLSSRPENSPPGLKSALQAILASNLPPGPQICPPDLTSAFHIHLDLTYSLSGRLEIHPHVLQDISPFGPLPCSHYTSSFDHSEQGMRYC